MAPLRVGLTAVVVNNYMYAFNGWSGMASNNFYFNAEEIESVYSTGGACDLYFDFQINGSNSSATFPDTMSYRAGTVFFGAYFYFTGGSQTFTNNTTVSTVGRTSY